MVDVIIRDGQLVFQNIEEIPAMEQIARRLVLGENAYADERALATEALQLATGEEDINYARPDIDPGDDVPFPISEDHLVRDNDGNITGLKVEVQSGDYIGRLANYFGVSEDSLVTESGEVPDVIHPGQFLVIQVGENGLGLEASIASPAPDVAPEPVAEPPPVEVSEDIDTTFSAHDAPDAGSDVARELQALLSVMTDYDAGIDGALGGGSRQAMLDAGLITQERFDDPRGFSVDEQTELLEHARGSIVFEYYNAQDFEERVIGFEGTEAESAYVRQAYLRAAGVKDPQDGSDVSFDGVAPTGGETDRAMGVLAERLAALQAEFEASLVDVDPVVAAPIETDPVVTDPIVTAPDLADDSLVDFEITDGGSITLTLEDGVVVPHFPMGIVMDGNEASESFLLSDLSISPEDLDFSYPGRGDEVLAALQERVAMLQDFVGSNPEAVADRLQELLIEDIEGRWQNATFGSRDGALSDLRANAESIDGVHPLQERLNAILLDVLDQTNEHGVTFEEFLREGVAYDPDKNILDDFSSYGAEEAALRAEAALVDALEGQRRGPTAEEIQEHQRQQAEAAAAEAARLDAEQADLAVDLAELDALTRVVDGFAASNPDISGPDVAGLGPGDTMASYAEFARDFMMSPEGHGYVYSLDAQEQQAWLRALEVRDPEDGSTIAFDGIAGGETQRGMNAIGTDILNAAHDAAVFLQQQQDQAAAALRSEAEGLSVTIDGRGEPQVNFVAESGRSYTLNDLDTLEALVDTFNQDPFSTGQSPYADDLEELQAFADRVAEMAAAHPEVFEQKLHDAYEASAAELNGAWYRPQHRMGSLLQKFNEAAGVDDPGDDLKHDAQQALETLAQQVVDAAQFQSDLEAQSGITLEVTTP